MVPGYASAMASGRVLAAAFLAAVLAFIGSTLVAQRANQRASEEALAISRSAAPEIEALATTRARLRLLETRVLRRVGGELQAEVSSARVELEESLERDRSLVSTPEERLALGRLQAAVLAFDLSAERAIEQLRLGARLDATRTVRNELRRLADDADGAAEALVAQEARRAQDAAQGIETAIARVNRLAFQLDALSALVTVAAALLALRTVRAAERAQEVQRRVIERKAAELEMFAGRVAHDILGPLNTVSMAISVAQRDSSNLQGRGALARATSSLVRVGRIVDGLLEFARAGARAEPGATAEVAPAVRGLQDELAELAAQEGAQFVVEPFEMCAVACSPGVLLSLLSNLLRNAFKYLGDSTRRVVTLRIAPGRSRVRFEVQDTGPGVPAHLAADIFQPYVRGPLTGKPGIGLGLATVKRLVQSHGGDVDVKPAPGGGSIFWFELAAADIFSQPLDKLGAQADSAGALQRQPS